MQVKSFLPHQRYSEAELVDHLLIVPNLESAACASFVNANNRSLQHASMTFKYLCNSLKIKLNLHKGRVRHSRLRVLSWIQCGALDMAMKKKSAHFKLIPKELGNSECD